MVVKKILGAAAMLAVIGATAQVSAAASADTPVVVAFGGPFAHTNTPPNVADWSLPGCDPTQTTWVWEDNAYGNVELDTIGSAYIGDLIVWAQMTSTTPCAAIDSGSMTLVLTSNQCGAICGTAGNVSCNLPGTFVRVGADLVMVVGGSCTINSRPPIAVHLQGEAPTFLGASSSKVVGWGSGGGVYLPPESPYEFTNTTVSG
jgi:hypothetical protein